MLGDLIAGFCDEQRAGAVEIADGLDLVVLGHQGHRLSNQLVGLPDDIVEQVGHVERDALWPARCRPRGPAAPAPRATARRPPFARSHDRFRWRRWRNRRSCPKFHG